MSSVLKIAAVAGVLALLSTALAATLQEEEPPDTSVPRPKLLPIEPEPAPQGEAPQPPEPPPLPPGIGVPAKIELPPELETPPEETPATPAPENETDAAPPPLPIPTSDLEDEARPPLPPAAAAALESGNFWFERNGMELAAKDYDEVLRLAPNCHLAPEILYKLGMAYLLAEKTEEANKTFDQLVRKHLYSSWSSLILNAHFDEKTLSKFFKKKFEQARESKTAADAQQAWDVMTILRKRFGSDSNKTELIYKGGLCCRWCGEMSNYYESMRQVETEASDSSWAKLAALRTGGLEAFRQDMDELIQMTGVDEENVHLFQELAEKYYDRLQGEEKIKCRFHYARNLYDDDKSRSLKLLRELVQQHPQSYWAGEAAFGFAETIYVEGDLREAQKAYRDFAKKYPDSPRVEKARRWADWIDQQEECQAQLQRIVTAHLQRLAKEPFTFAANAELKVNGLQNSLKGQFAVQKNRFVIDVRFHESILSLVSNREGNWLLSSDQKTLYKVKHSYSWVPRLTLIVTPTDFNCFVGIAGGDGDPTPNVQIPPETASLIVNGILAYAHVQMTNKALPNGSTHQVFRFETAESDPHSYYEFEVEVKGEKIYEVRLYGNRGDGPGGSLHFDNIYLVEPIPEEYFAPPNFPNAVVREVEEANMELYSQFLRILGILGPDLLDPEKWRPR